MKKKKLTFADYALLGVFIVLAIIVLVLLIKVITNKPNKAATNFSIPIVDTKMSTGLSIDLYQLKEKDNAYILEIPSYHANDVAAEDITYTLSFKNNSEGKIVINKNDDTKNLADSKKEFTITEKFKENEKRIDTYKITVSGNIKEGDTLDLDISSK